MNFKELFQSKTFWTALGIIAVQVCTMFNVLTPDQRNAVVTILGALAAIFVRDGMITHANDGK